jgi:hypothetical protein
VAGHAHIGICQNTSHHKWTQRQGRIDLQRGGDLLDPCKLFNAGFEGSQWRAIDLFEKDEINARTLKSLVQETIAYNLARQKKVKSRARK